MLKTIKLSTHRCAEDGTVIDDLIAYKISNDEVLICVNASNIKKDWDWISIKPKI